MWKANTERQKEKQTNRQTDRERTPICWFISKFSQQLQPAQAEARNLELIVGLPYGWQEPKSLSHHLLLPKVYIIRKLELEAEPGLKPKHSLWDASISSSIMTAAPSTHPHLYFLTFMPHLKEF